MNKTPWLIAIAAAVCGGCETESPNFDSHLGSASANLIQAQTLDPATAGNPAPLAPAGADGQRMKNAVDVYRKDVPKPEQQVSRPIVFDVSNGAAGGGGG
jgi:hypothetical protein